MTQTRRQRHSFLGIVKSLVLVVVMAAPASSTHNPYPGTLLSEVEEAAESTLLSIPAEAFFRNGEGKIVSLSSLKGKVIFINFWATWCPPCIREMPSIHRVHTQFKDNENVVFMMIELDRNYTKAKRYMERNHYEMPVFSPAANIPPQYLGRSIPTTVVIDRSGNIALRHEGAANFDDPRFVRFISDLLRTP